jgi:hypothetical protein
MKIKSFREIYFDFIISLLWQKLRMPKMKGHT